MKLTIIEKTLDKLLLPNHRCQGYINQRFNKPGFQVVSDTLFTDILKNTYFKFNGFKYEICDQLDSLNSSMNDYNWSDIKKTDVVLDIGANIGGFSIPISKKVKHVFAVEPIFPEILQKNINLNNIENITIISDIGLGIPNNIAIYGLRKKRVCMKSLQDIIMLCGGHIDFLKCDCEGGEWSIKTEELGGIRRIEMEVHRPIKKLNHTDFEKIIKDAGFIYKKEIINIDFMLMHCWRKK